MRRAQKQHLRRASMLWLDEVYGGVHVGEEFFGSWDELLSNVRTVLTRTSALSSTANAGFIVRSLRRAAR